MNIDGRLLQPHEAEEPILARPVRAALMEWLMEIWSAEELADVGLKARSRALFHGAPGTGKTTLAHHLAARLGLPMLIIRPDDIVGRYVGTGISNVRSVFDVIDKIDEPCVVFFDEFETVAARRMTSGVNEVGEHDHNAMINALLARMDAHEGFLIAATNHASLIDPAIWRRFEIQIKLDVPGQGERERILARYLTPFGLPRDDLRRIAEAMSTAAPSLMRQFCEALKRQIVVGPKAGWPMEREAVIARILAANEPHPDLGRPRLWSLGIEDAAIRGLGWPLRRAADIAADPEPAETADQHDEHPPASVVAFPGRATSRGGD
ncbi:AAA family ATPase [Methylobrevis pamukkalensis]|uniref:ATP-dependent zinc metalloprotease FtsH n=1 Tax=Methylobrevis pamukkalensis TaxID=1439726 RepID=A0A1E3GYW6_9HYPH|nr:ATP-binding protein [Methylobrevis pamukkalensis]ODN69224.1 ATP-dependent zinc metalloprotease FtsH [Methylobrevis pamukkalensis]